jgi:hypothetical protein
MESDWQLVQLEMEGKTDGTLSEDSDLLPLGSKCLISKFSLKSSDVVVISSDEAREVVGKKITGGEWTRVQFIDYCIFMGCDYVPKMENFGPVAAELLMKSWIQLKDTEKLEILDLVERSGNWNGGTGRKRRATSLTSRTGLPNYCKTFLNARNLFLHPPVFKLNGAMNALISVEIGYLNSSSSSRNLPPIGLEREFSLDILQARAIIGVERGIMELKDILLATNNM